MTDPASHTAGGADLKRTRRRRVEPLNGHTDRPPPHSEEAERGVIGCILLDPRATLAVVRKLGLTPDQFYDLRHESLCRALFAMDDAPQPIDVITLQQRLKDDGLLEQIGGIPYLVALQDSVPSVANVTRYLDIVQEKFQFRRAIRSCADIVAKIHNHEGGAGVLLDEFERDAMAVRLKRVTKTTVKDVVHGALAAIEEKFNRRGTVRGLPTGFPDLDRVLDGLCASELIVPAAFPSGGKTSLSMNFVEHLVMAHSLPVAVFTLEMTAEQLAVRLISSAAKVNMRDVPAWTEFDFARMSKASAALAASGLHVVEDAETISQIVAESRRLKQEHGVRLIVVDYLQLVVADKRGKDQNREQEVASVAGALKRLAKELKIPVIAPSQLNDDGQLRESRAIGQHCDVELLLKSAVKKAKGRTDDEIAGDYADVEPVNVFVAKNRNGPKGVTVPLTFMKCFTRFESAAKEQQPEGQE